jgi:phage terminase small subunit
MKLSPRQEKFAQGIASGLNQSAALKLAYPKSAQWTPATVHERASRLMRIGKVYTRITELQSVAAELACLDGAEVMREIKRIAMSDIGKIVDSNGRIKLPHELDDATRAAIALFEIDEYGRIRYKFWDKNAALINAAKILGLFAADNKQQLPVLVGEVRLVALEADT